MIRITNKQNCCGCYACYNICPQRCIRMQADEEGFWYPEVELNKCIDCGFCEKVCPLIGKNIGNNNEVDCHSDIVSYACMNKNESIRMQSSSGGMFTLLAETVISNNGVIFGAGFDDAFHVVHSYTETIEGLEKFRGSKYVQSKIGETYTQAKFFLEQGKRVLFTGTPCQIAGLHSCLGKTYENLVCVDIICHGVPSPLVFKKYRLELERRYGATAKRIAFRCKDRGWKLYSVSLSFENDTEYKETLAKDLFMQGFLKDLYLRPSCYRCRFKTLNRISDFTLADFWGIENILPQYDDNKGTSLVLIHSEKGAELFSTVADKTNYIEVDLAQGILYNSAAIESVAMNPKRKQFFSAMSATESIGSLIEQYTKRSFVQSFFGKSLIFLSRFKRFLVGTQ